MLEAGLFDQGAVMASQTWQAAANVSIVAQAPHHCASADTTGIYQSVIAWPLSELVERVNRLMTPIVADAGYVHPRAIGSADRTDRTSPL